MYKRSQEMQEIVSSLIRKRQDLFGDMTKYIFPEMISCALRIDKPAPKSQKKVLQIKSVKGPYTILDVDSKYIIFGYESMWDALPQEKKVAWISNMLFQIDYPTEEEMKNLIEKSIDYEYGKLKKPDVFDFKSFLKDSKLGLDWMEEGVSIGNILDDENVLKTE